MCNHQFIEDIRKLLVTRNYSGVLDYCSNNMYTILQGKKLYKYTAIADYSLANLKKNQLYMNNPRSFNDPFDCWIPKEQAHRQYTLEMESCRDPILNSCAITTKQRDVFNQSDNQREKEIYALLNKFIDERTLVVCLSECPPTNIILWSHYGNYHKGMCLEYDFSNGNATEEIYKMIKPVIYSNVHAIIEPIIGVVDVNYYACVALLSALSKSCEWEYEHEWRLVKYCSPNNVIGEQPVPIQCLKHIYLGACVNERGNREDINKYNERLNWRDEIIKFANDNNIPINQMEREDNSYVLKPISVGSARVT
jgi:hypothetical protein